jgi:ribosomal protein S15P/S13E
MPTPEEIAAAQALVDAAKTGEPTPEPEKDKQGEETKLDVADLTEKIGKLNNHLAALKRKGEAPEEDALKQIESHLAELAKLAKPAPEKEPEKPEKPEKAKDGETTDDRVTKLEGLLAKSQQETEVAKVAQEFNLSKEELETIMTDDPAELKVRAEKLRRMVDVSHRRQAASVPKDLEESPIAHRLLNT